eukprot:NODE_185_length_15706_cov_0.275902.p7 type:complete len:212 gc:universal NODE_185_length_15706_cov_0.275902:8541-7906(-)
MSNVGLPSAKGSATSGYVQKNLSAKLSNKHFEPLERKKRVADPKLIEHSIKRMALLKKIRGNSDKPIKFELNTEVTSQMQKEKQMDDLANALGINRSKHVEGRAFENIRKLDSKHIVLYTSSSSESSSSESDSSESEDTASEDLESDFKLVDTFEKEQQYDSNTDNNQNIKSKVNEEQIPDALEHLRQKVEDSKRKPSERIKELLLKKKRT